MHEPSTKQKCSRIPLALQAVFLASNRGKEVYQPPPDNSASKVFSRNWLFQRRGNERRNGKAVQRQLSFVERRSTGSGHNSEAVKGRPQATQTSKKSTSDKSLRSSSKHSSSTLTLHSSGSSCTLEPEVPQVSPQTCLDGLFQVRGLSNERFKVLESGYSNKPTLLQTSSYDPLLVKHVKNGDAEALEKMLQAGISPNPCSITGESLIHLICRRGDSKLLKLFLDYGASIQVSDTLGRTPLHEASWTTPSFDCIELILKADAHLLRMVDGRGATPLAYIRKDYWSEWIDFLHAKQDLFLAHAGQVCSTPPLTLKEQGSLPLLDPLDALSPKVAALIVSGQLSPENAAFIDDAVNVDADIEDSCDDDSTSRPSEYDNCDDTCFTEDTFDMVEMENLLLRLSSHDRSCK